MLEESGYKIIDKKGFRNELGSIIYNCQVDMITDDEYDEELMLLDKERKVKILKKNIDGRLFKK